MIHFEAVTVTLVTTYPSDPQVTCPFPTPTRWEVTANQAAAGVTRVFFSFDGVHDHGVVYPTGNAVRSKATEHGTKIWLRRDNDLAVGAVSAFVAAHSA